MGGLGFGFREGKVDAFHLHMDGNMTWTFRGLKATWRMGVELIMIILTNLYIARLLYRLISIEAGLLERNKLEKRLHSATLRGGEYTVSSFGSLLYSRRRSLLRK